MEACKFVRAPPCHEYSRLSSPNTANPMMDKNTQTHAPAGNILKLSGIWRCTHILLYTLHMESPIFFAVLACNKHRLRTLSIQVPAPVSFIIWLTLLRVVYNILCLLVSTLMEWAAVG